MTFNEYYLGNFSETAPLDKRKKELDIALARYNELFVPGSKKILVLHDSDYVTRLEAAYLDMVRQAGWDTEEGRESLERIKRGKSCLP